MGIEVGLHGTRERGPELKTWIEELANLARVNNEQQGLLIGAIT